MCILYIHIYNSEKQILFDCFEKLRWQDRFKLNPYWLLVLIVIENVFCVDKILQKLCILCVFISTDDFLLFFKVNLLS